LKVKYLYVLIFCAAALSACGTVNSAMVEKHKTVEFYRIFDIQTTADRDAVSNAASKGMGRWVNNESENRPITSWATPPEKPGRFSFSKNQLTGNAAFFMAMAGQSTKILQCNDAIWVNKAQKDLAGTGGINLTACLFQYQKGYHLDIYGTYTDTEGFTLDPVELGKKLGAAVVGSAGEWLEKVTSDTLLQIKNDLQAQVSFIEGYPKPVGLPWWSSESKQASNR